MRDCIVAPKQRVSIIDLLDNEGEEDCFAPVLDDALVSSVVDATADDKEGSKCEGEAQVLPGLKK